MNISKSRRGSSGAAGLPALRQDGGAIIFQGRNIGAKRRHTQYTQKRQAIKPYIRNGEAKSRAALWLPVSMICAVVVQRSGLAELRPR